MKVVHVFNLANDAYNIVKYMRLVGIDVDLVLNKQDFGMALPQWEDGQIARGVDPYHIRPNEIEIVQVPGWIKFWDQLRFGESPLARAVNRIDLYRLVDGYDIVEAHQPFAIYAQLLGKPYVVYDAGWVRYFPFGDNPRDKLARRGYMKASVVLVTNPDTFYIFDRLPYVKRTLFMPFVIDTDIYMPLRSEVRPDFECDLLFFCPSRHIWHEKGNDKMIRGFSDFVRTASHISPLLLLVDWGPDAERTKRLVVDLKISQYVRMIKPVHKRDLVEYYNAADVVLDQFVLGSYGTAAPEAMACEKPVVMYYSQKAFMRAFKELPPLLNAFTSSEISKQLNVCLDESYRREVGKLSRQWVVKHHNWRLVVDRHVQAYSYVQGECDWEDVLNK